jgi:chorismate mutase
MEMPQATHHPILPDNIGDVRSRIDALDSQIAALIAQRCGLSASVSAAKRAGGDAAFGWRPTREVEILRTVLRDQASLDPELAFCVWRALISSNLSAQGDLAIYAIAQTQSRAKDAFSVGASPQVFSTEEAVLMALKDNDHAIGFLPWPALEASQADWWVAMMKPEFAALHVCSASPICGSGPEVMLVAARHPEKCGEDISLVAGPVGAIEGGVIAQVGDLALVACGDYISADTPLPKGCRLIGTFALA